jgi:hypothetical protein
VTGNREPRTENQEPKEQENKYRHSALCPKNCGTVPAQRAVPQRNREPRTAEPSISESGDRIPGNVLPTHDPTEDALNFAEENFEKTLRLWAGITFSGVPVQSRRVWRGFGDDNATRFDEENFEKTRPVCRRTPHRYGVASSMYRKLVPWRNMRCPAAYHPRTNEQIANKPSSLAAEA